LGVASGTSPGGYRLESTAWHSALRLAGAVCAVREHAFACAAGQAFAEQPRPQTASSSDQSIHEAEWDRKVSGERQRQVPEVTPRAPAAPAARLASPRLAAWPRCPLLRRAKHVSRLTRRRSVVSRQGPTSSCKPSRAATSCTDRTRAPSSAGGLIACDMLLCVRVSASECEARTKRQRSFEESALTRTLAGRPRTALRDKLVRTTHHSTDMQAKHMQQRAGSRCPFVSRQLRRRCGVRGVLRTEYQVAELKKDLFRLVDRIGWPQAILPGEPEVRRRARHACTRVRQQQQSLLHSELFALLALTPLTRPACPSVLTLLSLCPFCPSVLNLTQTKATIDAVLRKLEALSPAPQPLQWQDSPGGQPGVSPLLLGDLGLCRSGRYEAAVA
jgi:hypothetical protein